MTAFKFHAAYPGSGKTQTALTYALWLCHHHQQKVLFVLPTIALIQELTSRAQGLMEEWSYADISLKSIYSSASEDGVKQRVIDHIQTTPHDQPEMLLITLRTFLSIAPWPNPHAWRHVFVDEAFNPFEDHSLQLVENFRVLTDRVTLANPSAEFSLLKPRHGAAVRESVNDPLERNDAVNQLLHPILSRVVNPNFSVYAHVPTWNKVLAGDGAGSDPRLFIYSEITVRAFQAFENVTFLGAWLQNHAFFRLWTQEHHTFKVDEVLSKFVVRRNGWNRSDDRIAYFTERHWTSTYATTKLADGRTPLEHIDQYLSDELDGFSFGWTKNASQKLAYDGVYIPPRAAGLNQYSDLTVLVWLASTLPHPNMWRFLNWRGMSDEHVRMEFYWLPLAQFMSRGADRRRDFDGKMVKVVPDLHAARFLHGLFLSPLVRIGTIPVEDNRLKYKGKAGRPRGHARCGGRPRSQLTQEQRREQRNLKDRQRYAARRQC